MLGIAFSKPQCNFVSTSSGYWYYNETCSLVQVKTPQTVWTLSNPNPIPAVLDSIRLNGSEPKDPSLFCNSPVTEILSEGTSGGTMLCRPPHVPAYT
jgi:hypothetical protein